MCGSPRAPAGPGPIPTPVHTGRLRHTVEIDRDRGSRSRVEIVQHNVDVPCVKHEPGRTTHGWHTVEGRSYNHRWQLRPSRSYDPQLARLQKGRIGPVVRSQLARLRKVGSHHGRPRAELERDTSQPRAVLERDTDRSRVGSRSVVTRVYSTEGPRPMACHRPCRGPRGSRAFASLGTARAPPAASRLAP